MIVNDPDLKEIYVRLIDEVVEVWKAVTVKWVIGSIYEIVDLDKDEIFEFQKGERIHGLRAFTNDGSIFIIAIKSYDGWTEMDFSLFKSKYRKNKTKARLTVT